MIDMKHIDGNKIIVDFKLTTPKLVVNEFVVGILEKALILAKQGKVINIIAAIENSDGTISTAYSSDWKVRNVLLSVELLNEKIREWVGNIE